MNRIALVDILTYLEPAACLCALALVVYRKELKKFSFLSAFLGVRILSLLILLPLLWLAAHGVSRQITYPIYFYTYWASYLLEAVLGFGIIYQLFQLSMAPLPGLQRLGTLMFRWAAGIAVVLAISMGFTPHMTGITFMVRSVTQLQQTESVLTLCLLLFVCVVSRPIGLTHRSKVFGISMGLGTLAASDLVISSWLSNVKSMHSLVSMFNGVSICLALAIWATYFALPEPKRRMILLPTTSPFLRWNQISAVLGDEPGFVAIGEVTPEMFAPAELDIMLRASAKLSQPTLSLASNKMMSEAI